MTNYRRTFDVTKISESEPPEKRPTLPAPEVMGEIYRWNNLFVVDLRCPWNDRNWSLCSTRLKALIYSLGYFKSLDKYLIARLKQAVPRPIPPIIAWQKRTAWQCVTCKDVARLKPGQDREIFGCVKCGEGIEIERSSITKKHKSDYKLSTKKTPTPITEKQEKLIQTSMNAMQRLRAKKGIE